MSGRTWAGVWKRWEGSEADKPRPTTSSKTRPIPSPFPGAAHVPTNRQSRQRGPIRQRHHNGESVHRAIADGMQAGPYRPNPASSSQRHRASDSRRRGDDGDVQRGAGRRRLSLAGSTISSESQWPTTASIGCVTGRKLQQAYNNSMDHACLRGRRYNKDQTAIKAR